MDGATLITTGLPNTLIGWVSVIAIVIIAGAMLYNQLNPVFRARRREIDEMDEEMIQKLREKLGVKDEEIKEYRERDLAREKELSHIKGQYSTVIEVLQGRDEATQAVMKKAPEIFDVAKNTNELAKETHRTLNGLATTVMEIGTGMKTLTDEVSKLTKALERNIDNGEDGVL